MQEQNFSEFRQSLAKIENLYHIKEFKTLNQTKLNHLKNEKRFHPSDFTDQVRRMFLHTIYLYYIGYVKKKDFYFYPHICVDRWGLIFKYYSFKEDHNKFMDKIESKNFRQNISSQFKFIWNLISVEQEETEQKKQEKQKPNALHPWTQFSQLVVEMLSDKTTSPKDIISKLEQSRQMKNDILILGILSSTIFSCIKLHSQVEKAYQLSFDQESSIIKKIFSKDYENEGTKDFVNYFLRFFKILNDFKILGITTTLSDKSSPKPQLDQSLLTQFYIAMGRPMKSKEGGSQVSQLNQDLAKNSTSNQSSEHDYNEGNDGKDINQLKCQFFWGKKFQTKQLNFRISIFVNKKIYPLYFHEIEGIWYRLCQKWKVILDEDKQLSGFNPGFVFLDYNKDSHQLTFTNYVKYQPGQHVLSELILATDKLIISVLAMKNVVCYYERRSHLVEMVDQELMMNDGRLQNLALSICQTIKNYYCYCKRVISFNPQIKGNS